MAKGDKRKEHDDACDRPRRNYKSILKGNVESWVIFTVRYLIYSADTRT